MTVVEKEKRKVVDVKVYVSMLRNSVINNYTLLVTSPLFLRWRRFLLRRERKSKEDNPYVALVHGKRSSRVGIFSMVDVLGDEDYSWRKEGADSEDLLRIYRKFSKFVTVVDHSDHFFSAESSAMNQILAENLPETIYVRVYEDRVDLLTAVIIGPQGTPYQNGLFFFDVCFPSNYPVSPPLVHYRSGGLGINPNLYKCGKVHLNLPKTGSIGQEKLWAGNSTILQLLLSIQDRILNTNPLYNDITYSVMKGSVYGEQSSTL
ncbi:ubiquitin-conjugating enzyme/RWD-like protein [Tanacetum coccineum]